MFPYTQLTRLLFCCQIVAENMSTAKVLDFTVFLQDIETRVTIVVTVVLLSFSTWRPSFCYPENEAEVPKKA